MSESLGRPSRRRPLIIAIVIMVVIVAGILIVGVLSMNQGSAAPGADASASPQATASPTTPTDPDDSTEGGTVEPTPAFGSVLPEAMGGQEAIDALGDDLQAVADRNGKTVEELTALLLRDATAKVSPSGFIVYSDSFENDE
ncbi:hypothetical protein [Microbacterium sp.]|uniref:hypothetical protein n=1 Tax=Microbacterium sp. TaxID=51671 RepID=UPI002FE23294